ncbi:unnamed protein product [Phytophthora lilii]|uniref:Unnamed protein product n=1 Tax=Phytophthora lilii TaxID=2077276 RepID=A0A9W6X4F5_9STRA|nr:unnamed protein product [Phytophthora lilii]
MNPYGDLSVRYNDLALAVQKDTVVHDYNQLVSTALPTIVAASRTNHAEVQVNGCGDEATDIPANTSGIKVFPQVSIDVDEFLSSASTVEPEGHAGCCHVRFVRGTTSGLNITTNTTKTSDTATTPKTTNTSNLTNTTTTSNIRPVGFEDAQRGGNVPTIRQASNDRQRRSVVRWAIEGPEQGKSRGIPALEEQRLSHSRLSGLQHQSMPVEKLNALSAWLPWH